MVVRTEREMCMLEETQLYDSGCCTGDIKLCCFARVETQFTLETNFQVILSVYSTLEEDEMDILKWQTQGGKSEAHS